VKDGPWTVVDDVVADCDGIGPVLGGGGVSIVEGVVNSAEEVGPAMTGGW
jgi:hypothetical protein